MVISLASYAPSIGSEDKAAEILHNIQETLKSEDVSECIDLELLYWDGKEDSFAKIIPYIDNHLFDKYIREIVIPSLSTHIINTHINKLEKLSKLEPDFLNRLNELANLDDKFNPSILKLLNYKNR